MQPEANGLLCDVEMPENLPDMFVLSSNGNYIVRKDAFKKWIIQDGVENQLARAQAFSVDPVIGTPPPFFCGPGKMWKTAYRKWSLWLIMYLIITHVDVEYQYNCSVASVWVPPTPHFPASNRSG